MKSPDKHFEAVDTWAGKSPIEQALSVGLYGPPELKRGEKLHYLGEFKERIIRLLTKGQVVEPTIYHEIIEALKDERADKMLINGVISERFTRKYEMLAQELGKPYTVVHNPKLKGDVGLAVVANDAVEVDEITVVNREERLSQLGLHKLLIDAVGEKVCSRCLETITLADPSETENYQSMIWVDRLLGISCKACGRKP